MPIKIENKHRYPANWKEIRQRILARAHNRCEFCGVENHSYVDRYRPNHQGGQECYKVKVVMTIAHMDNVPEHCDESNLKALCQKCHLTYDAQFHARNAAITRANQREAKERENGQLSLF